MAKKAGAALAERKQNTSGRNYGIDLLRCVSMLLIVVLHIYNQGGLLNAISKKETYYVNYTLRLIALGSVNLYAMISGFVMLHGSFKLRRLIGLWLQVVFWGLALCGVGTLVLPEAIGGKQWIRAAFPVTQKRVLVFLRLRRRVSLEPDYQSRYFSLEPGTGICLDARLHFAVFLRHRFREVLPG